MNTKQCRYCGLEFIANHGNDGLCSEECTKGARKLRNFNRYNSVSSLLPVLLRNHGLLNFLYKKKQLTVTAEELENDGLDFSLFRRLYPEPNNISLVRLDFGTYYLDTEDNFQTFKLNIHETKTSNPE
jgi:hypothetical protein